jgi:hypothetical protein
MAMGMMGIGEMAVAVTQADVDMAMEVRLARGIIRPMTVLVVGIMAMTMGMGEQRVLVLVLMALGEMKPQPGQHQRASERELRGERLSEGHNCENGADKGRGGEVGAGPRGADVA